MDDKRNIDVASEVSEIQPQFDEISSSYLTITNDLENALRISDQAIDECRSKIQELDYLTSNLFDYCHRQTANTEYKLKNANMQISQISEKFDLRDNSFRTLYRYQVGDHIFTFEKKLNWFRRFLLKLIFGSCEIR